MEYQHVAILQISHTCLYIISSDKIIVFGGKNERYDIPVSEIQQTGANVLIGRSFKDIVHKYKVNRENPLPSSREDPWTSPSGRIDLAIYEKEYKILV
jgi:hypothetical protein